MYTAKTFHYFDFLFYFYIIGRRTIVLHGTQFYDKNNNNNNNNKFNNNNNNNNELLLLQIN